MEEGLRLISLAQHSCTSNAGKVSVNDSILENSESMKRKKPVQETIERSGQYIMLERANGDLDLF
jgi:hypothetical protein